MGDTDERPVLVDSGEAEAEATVAEQAEGDEVTPQPERRRRRRPYALTVDSERIELQKAEKLSRRNTSLPLPWCQRVWRAHEFAEQAFIRAWCLVLNKASVVLQSSGAVCSGEKLLSGPFVYLLHQPTADRPSGCTVHCRVLPAADVLAHQLLALLAVLPEGAAQRCH